MYDFQRNYTSVFTVHLFKYLNHCRNTYPFLLAEFTHIKEVFLNWVCICMQGMYKIQQTKA